MNLFKTSTNLACFELAFWYFSKINSKQAEYWFVLIYVLNAFVGKSRSVQETQCFLLCFLFIIFDENILIQNKCILWLFRIYLVQGSVVVFSRNR